MSVVSMNKGKQSVRKLLIGFMALIVLVVAGVLIGPSFIDWNSYKADIAAQVKSMTGRDLVIDCDIYITVLPAPAVIANDVMFANVTGGSSPQMVRLKSLAVNVALGPLLSGDIQVTKVQLVEPVVVLEVLADGSQNWMFEDLDTDAATSSAAATTPSASIDLSTGLPSPDASTENDTDDVTAGPGLQLDNFEIINGTIIYRDPTTATEERIEDLNATLTAASLNGPFESIGSLVVRGIPISFEVGVDGVFQGRTVPINAMVRSDKADASVIFNGTIVNLSDDAKFTGRLKAEGQSLASVMSAVAQTGEMPGGLNQSFSAEGDVTATASGITVDALVVKLGDTSASGAIDVNLAEILSASADFTINHINLDKFLTQPTYTGAEQSAGDGSITSDSSGTVSSGTASSGADSSSVEQLSEATASIVIPGNIAASFTISVDAITYQGEKVGPVRLNAELANGEVTLSQFSTQLPGATDVAVFGFMSIQDGGPVFEGEAEISVGDTHSLTRWLKIDMPDLPNGRLRHIKARANIKATVKDVQVSGVDVAFDGSHLTGGITVALRRRPAFGASFALDRIDLEGYLPEATDTATNSGQATTTATTAVNGNAADTTGAADGSGAAAPSMMTNPLTVLSALTSFDANMKATVGAVVHQGIQIRNIEFDGALFNGALTVKNASVADLAGASAAISGGLSELGGNPRFDDLSIKFKTKSMQKIADFLALDLPVSAKALGSVATAISLDGPVLQPSLKASLNAAGAQTTFDGGISMLPLKDMIDGDVTFKHGDVAKLLRAFGVAYQPSGKIGGLSLSTSLSGGADKIALENLTGALGKLKFNGSTTLRLDGNVPKIVAAINTNEVIVDPFMPTQKNAVAAASSSTSTSTSSSTSTPDSSQSSGAPWSDEPLDLSALRGLDGDFRIHSDAIVYDVYRLEDANVVATLTDGVLKADHVTANVFGSRINVKGMLNSQGTPSADATVSIENANIAAMLSALLGQPTATGALSFETALNARGLSVADMVAALDGKGSFLLKGLDVQGSGKGTAFAGILGLVQSFGQLGSGLTGQSMDGLADASGSFVMNKGVAQIGDFRLASGMGDGTAAGSIDLANWQMDVSGAMKMSQSILGQILVLKAGAPAELPFRVSGTLDSPTVKLETALLGDVDGTGISLPGLEKLEEKLPGVGGLLQGVLGGVLGGGTIQQQPEPQVQSDTQSQQTPEPQPQPQPQTPEAQPLSPENVIKQLLQF